MWEIWEGGAEPYGWASNKEVYDDVLEGNILKPSKKMPQIVKDLMRKCLSIEAEERPTFQQIVEYLKAHRKEILATAPSTESPKVTKAKEIEDPIIITKEPTPYDSTTSTQQHSTHYVQTPTDSLKSNEALKKEKAKEPKEETPEGNYGKTPVPIQQLESEKESKEKDKKVKEHKEKEKEESESESDKEDEGEGNYLKTPVQKVPPESPKDEKKEKEKKKQNKKQKEEQGDTVYGSMESVNPKRV